MIRAVTFDFWNTLVVPENDLTRETRTDAVVAAIRATGMEVTREQVEQAFVGLFEIFTEHWAGNRQFRATEAADIVVDRLAPGISPAARDGVAEAFAGAAVDLVPELTPNVSEALAALQALGVSIGIICDVGMTPSAILRTYLEHHGVLERFDHFSFSDEVGVYKPDRRIFDHALAGLGGVDPREAAHVGDLRRTDVAGARDRGMVSVRYRGSHDDSGDVGDVGELVEAHHVIDDHSELVGVLGLG